MYSYKYFTPAEVRQGARQIMENPTGEAKDKTEIAKEIGCTVENLWTACREKAGEDPQTMRGIPTCVQILKAAGVNIDEVPCFKVTQVIIQPQVLPLDVPPPSKHG